MKTALKHLAKIQTGLFAKPITQGQIVYLQFRHFDENRELIADLHPDLLAGSVDEKHLLRPGDILFAAKGTKNFAAAFEDHSPSAVASSSFFVIRLNEEPILTPHYLAWFLNHPNTQKYLKINARGSSIASISKTVLQELEIPVPDISIQDAILKISNLRNKENKLKQKIEILKEKKIQQQLINAIK